jgi:hypothetical protein
MTREPADIGAPAHYSVAGGLKKGSTLIFYEESENDEAGV